MSETTRSASDQRLVDQAKELRLQGMTIPQVAKAVDRSPSWVSKVVGPMTAPKPKFTKAQMEAIKEDYLGGMSYPGLAEKYDRSLFAITGLLKDMGIQGQGGKTVVASAKKEDVIARWKRGELISEIHKATGVAKSAISNWTYGIEGGAGVREKLDKAEAVRLYTEADMPVEYIAKKLRRGSTTISNWLKSEGVEILPSMSRRTSEQQRMYGKKGAEVRHNQAVEIRRTCGRDGCDETFVLRHRNEDRKYCSRACFNKARTDETKRAIFTCEACGRQFEHWASQANRRYCSMDCRLANIGKTAKRYRIGEEQIDSSWEALVIGLLQVLKISYKRDIRDEVVEWSVGHKYAPDFKLGDGLYIEVKGLERETDRAKWRAWREKRGELVVIDSTNFQEVMSAGATGRATLLATLHAMASEQGNTH